MRSVGSGAGSVWTRGDRGGRHRFRSGRRRRIAVALVPVLTAGVLAFATGATPAEAYVTGPDCADVMVIAARGSGEQPQDDWTDPAGYSNPATKFGAGDVNFDFYTRLSGLAPQLRFALNSVRIPPMRSFRRS